MGKTVLTFGEIMMRLSPKDHLRIEQATEFDVRYGGAEANTALSLAYQGDKAAYVSVVPANRLGECALRSLKAYGVDTTRVVRQGDRLGSYVFEVGASQRGNGCVYDRKYSAINMAKRDVFNWDEILKGIDVFYFSGVTPAVSDEMAAACKDALTVCRAKGITTVCDVNYRGKMWSPEKSQATMRELLPLVDICIANDEDAPAGLGMTCVSGSLAHGIEERDTYVEMAQARSAPSTAARRSPRSSATSPASSAPSGWACSLTPRVASTGSPLLTTYTCSRALPPATLSTPASSMPSSTTLTRRTPSTMRLQPRSSSSPSRAIPTW